MSLPEVITFGCRLNAYESEVIRARANEAGLRNTIGINTCAVTKEAVRQSKQAIRRQKRVNPDAKIIVTSCVAMTEPQTFAQMVDIDLILVNSDKPQLPHYEHFGTRAAERVMVNDIFSLRETAAQFVDGFGNRERAF